MAGLMVSAQRLVNMPPFLSTRVPGQGTGLGTFGTGGIENGATAPGWGGGRYASISEMAAERIWRGYLGSLLRLTPLAPDIVEAILDGRQPEGLGLPRLTEPFPLDWLEQRAALESESQT